MQGWLHLRSRPAGPIDDSRTKRVRTRGAEEQAALSEFEDQNSEPFFFEDSLSDKPKAIICDLDGTLASVDHRRYLVDDTCKSCMPEGDFYKQSEPKADCPTCSGTGIDPELKSKKQRNWEAFHELSSIDSPVPAVVDLLRNANNAGHKIIFSTGRPDIYRYQTQWWLAENLPWLDEYELMMRKSKPHRKCMGTGCDNCERGFVADQRPDDVVKEEMYRQSIEPNFDVQFAIDDRPSVIAKWKELGLPVIECEDPKIPPIVKTASDDEQKIAAWADVRNKARRLRRSGDVEIIRLEDDVIIAKVKGDHRTYEVEIFRQYPNAKGVTFWSCSCKWGEWAFKRQKTYIGRFCSHALATLYEAHSQEYRKKASSTESYIPNDNSTYGFSRHDFLSREELDRIHEDLAEEYPASFTTNPSQEYTPEAIKSILSRLPEQDSPDEEIFQTGSCAAWAVAHWALNPHLRFGIDWETPLSKMDTGVQHVFTHDDNYAYDSTGRHDLRDLPSGLVGRFDFTTLNHTIHQILEGAPSDWGLLDLDDVVYPSAGQVERRYQIEKTTAKEYKDDIDIPSYNYIRGDNWNDWSEWAGPSTFQKYQPKKKYEFDPQIDERITKALESLSSRYPITNSWFRGHQYGDLDITKGSAFGCILGDGTIFLNKNEVFNPNSQIVNPWNSKGGERYAVGQSLEELTAHEFAHVLHMSITKDALGELPEWNIQHMLDDTYLPIVRPFVNHEDNPVHKITQEAKANNPKAFVSKYAQRDELENFAEAMLDYWTSPEPEPYSREIGTKIDALYHRDSGRTAAVSKKVVINSRRGPIFLDVEVAETPIAIQNGLMYRSFLPMNQGMLFDFKRPTTTGFWMQNVSIPLSIAFIDNLGRIIDIQDMGLCFAGACPSYSPNKPFTMAIEVNQGWFKFNGVNVGDYVNIT